MNKKIFGIFICILLTLTAVVPLLGETNISGLGEVCDQNQKNCDEYKDFVFKRVNLKIEDNELFSNGFSCDSNGPYYGVAGEPIQFYGTASGGYEPYMWDWTFGDGKNSNQQNPTHIYDEVGNYNVLLTVIDGYEQVCTDETTATIIEEGDTEPPVVIINQPEDGAIFYEPNLEVKGKGTDNVGITTVGGYHEWDTGSYNVSDDLPEPHKGILVNWSLTLRSGWNNLTLYMYDSSYNYGEDTISVKYEGECENYPPDAPEDPIPGDGANLVDIHNITLRWFCLDLDVYDDVYFKLLFEANDSTPDVNISWQNESSYLIKELEPCTHYYWQVIANDGNGGISESPIWDFTTKDISPPDGYFINPKPYHFYFKGFDFGPFGKIFGKTIIFDWANVEVQADDNIGINSVTFFINDEPIEIIYEPPYKIRLFQGGSYELKASINDMNYNLENITLNITLIPMPDFFDDCEESFLILWPLRSQRGRNGNLVPGISDPDPEHFPRHYVSPVKGLQDWNEGGDYVIVEAGIQWGDCEPIPTFRWKPPIPNGVTISGTLAYVPRDNPGKYVLTGQLLRGQSVVSEDTMTVWIVKSTIDRDNSYPFKVTSQSNDRTLRLNGSIGFIHRIEPTSIFTDPNRPDLAGINTIAPPNVSSYATNVYNNDTDLSGGASKYWDNSRQVRIKTIFTDIPQWIQKWVYSNRFGPLWRSYEFWPSDREVGNDDAFNSDETNNPYTNVGILTGHDTPARTLPHIAKNEPTCSTAKVEIRFHFREFTRLQIGDKWFRISEYFLWRCHLKYKIDPIDPDGRKWIDDGSVTALGHSGW